jgi:hypothetical protein
MIMFPSSAIQVVEQTQSRLVVLDPPYYLMGWSFVVLALVLFVLPLIFARSNRARTVTLGRGIFALTFVLVGLGTLGSRTTTTFSREDQTMSVQRVRYAVFRSRTDYPLDSVRSATVETGRNSRRLTVLLNSGGVVLLSSLTDKPGQYAAADAINGFLHVSTHRD